MHSEGASPVLRRWRICGAGAKPELMFRRQGDARGESAAARGSGALPVKPPCPPWLMRVQRPVCPAPTPLPAWGVSPVGAAS